jgi:hypothetical protein
LKIEVKLTEAEVQFILSMLWRDDCQGEQYLMAQGSGPRRIIREIEDDFDMTASIRKKLQKGKKKR